MLDNVGVDNVENIYSLKVSGELNGTDIRTINKMSNLRFLDMTDANIIEGGLAYFYEYTTLNNTIGKYFFSGLSLYKIQLPNTVTTIDFSALPKELFSIFIPSSVEIIENYYFTGRKNLISLIIEDDSKTLSFVNGEAKYNDCPLNYLYLGRNIYYGDIDKSPFRGLTKLSSLVISNNVTRICDYMFKSCSGLTSVTIPNSVKFIQMEAFLTVFRDL